jgi:hypothetical protein
MPPSKHPRASVWPADGSMNYGIRVRYMIAAFGLAKFVIRPIRKSLEGLSGFGSRASNRAEDRARRIYLTLPRRNVGQHAHVSGTT